MIKLGLSIIIESLIGALVVVLMLEFTLNILGLVRVVLLACSALFLCKLVFSHANCMEISQ